MNFFHLFGSKFLSALHRCVCEKEDDACRQLVMAPTSSFYYRINQSIISIDCKETIGVVEARHGTCS